MRYDFKMMSQKRESKFSESIEDRLKGLQILGWLTGLEPATTGITILDSTN